MLAAVFSSHSVQIMNSLSFQATADSVDIFDPANTTSATLVGTAQDCALFRISAGTLGIFNNLNVNGIWVRLLRALKCRVIVVAQDLFKSALMYRIA